MCEVLEVSKSGYYDWLKYRSHISNNEKRDNFDQKVRATFLRVKKRYGSRRIHKELVHDGVKCSRTTVARAMKRMDLKAKRFRPFCVTTNSQHQNRVAPNLLNRDFSANAPNEKWAGDITYVWTKEGWLYLAVLIDLFSRRVVGWATSKTIDTNLVLKAFHMAVTTRTPAHGLVHHSDRGTQYASHSYRQQLAHHGMQSSMSRKGDCWDNAPSESFFASLKGESLFHHRFKTSKEAEYTIISYVLWYNTHRRHSALDYYSPIEYEKQWECLDSKH